MGSDCISSWSLLIFLLFKTRLYLVSVAEQAGLSLTWSETSKTCFLVTWVKLTLSWHPECLFFQIIYICRNPKASVLSLYKVLQYLNLPPAPSLREYFELFLKGYEGGTIRLNRNFCAITNVVTDNRKRPKIWETRTITVIILVSKIWSF